MEDRPKTEVCRLLWDEELDGPPPNPLTPPPPPNYYRHTDSQQQQQQQNQNRKKKTKRKPKRKRQSKNNNKRQMWTTDNFELELLNLFVCLFTPNLPSMCFLRRVSYIWCLIFVFSRSTQNSWGTSRTPRWTAWYTSWRRAKERAKRDQVSPICGLPPARGREGEGVGGIERGN